MFSTLRKSAAATAVIAGAALLAACGSGHSNPNAGAGAGATTTTAPPAASSTTASTAASTATTAPATGSTGSGATTPTTAVNTSTTPPGCLASQLKVVIGYAGAAAGSIGYTNSFVNTSGTACTLYGFPGMQMLTASGQSISTDVIRGSSVSTPAEPEYLVTLAPGGRALFNMGFSDGTGYGDSHCPASAKVEFTAPNDYQSITVDLSIQPYGGGTITNLHCGEIHVSPVFAS